MGTYYTHGATRKDIIQELINDRTLKHCLRGNVLWTVERRPIGGKEERFIGCYLLSRSTNGWGYKPMDETMCPYYFTCPKSYLKLCTPPINEYSEKWRRMLLEPN